MVRRLLRGPGGAAFADPLGLELEPSHLDQLVVVPAHLFPFFFGHVDEVH
jgi:hypothetical protein